MNKEQIDEIALRVASEIPCCCNHLTIEEGVAWSADEVKSYTHALLAELAKVSEPEAYMYHIKGNGKLTELAAIEYQEQFGETIIHKRALYSIPLPQPDLVDENERKEWALLMNADIEQLREQLATAQASEAELLKALEKIDEDAKDTCLASVRHLGRITNGAITAHKARKEK